MELDKSLPAPLNTVARWLLKTEKALAEEEGDPQDHGRAADDAREKQELLKVNIYCIQLFNCTTLGSEIDNNADLVSPGTSGRVFHI